MDAKPEKWSRMLVPFLLLAIAALVVMNMIQNRVIERQRTEIHWLLEQGIVMRVPSPAPKPAGSLPAPQAAEKAKAEKPAQLPRKQ